MVRTILITFFFVALQPAMNSNLFFIRGELATIQSGQLVSKEYAPPPVENFSHCPLIDCEEIRYARELEELFCVPACISIAQSILESNSGRSNLGANHCNLFGHKSFEIDEAYYYNGGRYCSSDSSCWRAYKNKRESYIEHGRFFLYTRQWNQEKGEFDYPYRALLQSCFDWRRWAKELQWRGYAGRNANDYASKLIDIIERDSLYIYNLNY